MEKPELITYDDPAAAACVEDGVEHDFRTYRAPASYSGGPERTYWRCVWCHVVSCGSIYETDPCIEPYHHRGKHRTRLGVTWPIGGNRPTSKSKTGQPLGYSQP